MERPTTRRGLPPPPAAAPASSSPAATAAAAAAAAAMQHLRARATASDVDALSGGSSCSSVGGSGSTLSLDAASIDLAGSTLHLSCDGGGSGSSSIDVSSSIELVVSARDVAPAPAPGEPAGGGGARSESYSLDGFESEASEAASAGLARAAAPSAPPRPPAQPAHHDDVSGLELELARLHSTLQRVAPCRSSSSSGGGSSSSTPSRRSPRAGSAAALPRLSPAPSASPAGSMMATEDAPLPAAASAAPWAPPLPHRHRASSTSAGSKRARRPQQLAEARSGRPSLAPTSAAGRRSVGVQALGVQDRGVQVALTLDQPPQPPPQPQRRHQAVRAPAAAAPPALSTWGVLSSSLQQLRTAALLDQLEQLLQAAEHQQRLHEALMRTPARAAPPAREHAAEPGEAHAPMPPQPQQQCRECQHRQQAVPASAPIEPPLPAPPRELADAKEAARSAKGQPEQPGAQQLLPAQAEEDRGNSCQDAVPSALPQPPVACSGWVTVDLPEPVPGDGAAAAAAAADSATLDGCQQLADAAEDAASPAAAAAAAAAADDSGWFAVSIAEPEQPQLEPAQREAPQPELMQPEPAKPQAAQREAPQPQQAPPAPEEQRGSLVHDAGTPAQPLVLEQPQPPQQAQPPQQVQPPSARRFSSADTLKRYAAFLASSSSGGAGGLASGLTARDAAALQRHLASVTATPAAQGTPAALLLSALRQVHAALQGGAGGGGSGAGGALPQRAGLLLAASNEDRVARSLQLRGLRAGLGRAKASLASLQLSDQRLAPEAHGTRGGIASGSLAAGTGAAALGEQGDCYTSLEATLLRIRAHRAARHGTAGGAARR